MSLHPASTACAWTVRVMQGGAPRPIGTVHGPSERVAREAAIGRFAVSGQELDAYHAGAAAPPAGIWPDDEFDVVRA